jgi:hypothetical protein
MHGFQKKAKRRRPGRQFDFGLRLAVLRAITAERRYAAGEARTLAGAARSTGSNIAYVAAVGVLRATGNTSLLQKALTGDTPLLAAAAEAKRLAKLTAEYRAQVADSLALHLTQASPAQRAEAARALGDPETVWAQMVLPLLEQDQQSAPAK